MSKYTTELRYICEWQAGLDHSEGYLAAVHEIIEKARPIIFRFDYDIFDPEYRPVIETKFLKRFYTRELCCETYGRWKLFLEDKFNELFPFYNKLYESDMLKFDPLRDYDLTRESSRDNAGQSSGHGSVSTDNTENRLEHVLYSDTPQGGLNGLDSNTYLTNATKNTAANTSGSDTTTNESTETTTTEQYLEHVFGKSAGGSYAKLLQEYRDTFLNIDNMLLDNCEDLFFKLW